MKTTAIALGALICFLAKTENVSAQYSDTVVITQQVECNLPQIINTTTVLTPCSSPNGFSDLQVGDTAFIVYSAGSCATICMQGTTIDIAAFYAIEETAGINNLLTEDEFSLFPQPTTGIFTVKTKQIIESIELFSTQGQLMLINTNGENKVDLTGLENGIYVVRINTKKGVHTTKISKI